MQKVKTLTFIALATALITALLTLSATSSFAQEKRLTLAEAFSLAEEQSASLAATRSAIDYADATVYSAKADRSPDIDINIQLSYIGNTWVADRDFSNGSWVSTPHFGNTFSIAATQVLYAGGAIKNNIEMASLKKDMATLAHENNTQGIRFLIAGYYLDLCQMQNRRIILEKNIAQTQKLLDDIKENYAAGTALKSDITRYELLLQGLELNLKQTCDAMDIANRNMTEALALPESTIIVPDTSFIGKKVNIGAEEDWQNAALSGPVLRQAQKDVAINEKAEELSKAGLRPTIALRIEDKLEGPITYEVPTLDNNVNYWYAGVNISYNLGSLYKQRRKVSEQQKATSTARLRQSDAERQISARVHAAYVKFGDAIFAMHTNEKAVQLAYENYDVIHYRYLNGMALITDMLDASNQQLNAELELMNSRISIAYCHYVLLNSVGQL